MTEPQTVDDVVEALEREARDKTGLDDFGGDGYVAPLRAWVTDLLGSTLNDMGKAFMRRLVTRELCRRLAIVDYLRTHPEIDDVELPPIVLITGPPRTGTTLLHNTVAAHRAARPMLRWELVHPLPPPTAETYRVDPRIAKTQAAMEPLRGSPLEHLHWVNADEPEECAWGYYDCTGLLGNGCWGVMPTWANYVWESQLASTYAEYRQLLKLLLWKNPAPDDGFLILKAPQTVSKIATFARAFPEARFVLTHRDPFRTLVSSAAVTAAICTPFSAGVVLDGDGTGARRIFDLMQRCYAAMTDFARTAPDRVVNLHYADLMDDAVDATRGVIDQLGIPDDTALADAIRSFLARQRDGHRAKPPAAYDSYGYDADAVWSDAVVSEYCDHFELRRETTRLADTRTVGR